MTLLCPVTWKGRSSLLEAPWPRGQHPPTLRIPEDCEEREGPTKPCELFPLLSMINNVLQKQFVI